MAWTLQAAFLCLLLKPSLVKADFQRAVGNIDHASHAIRLLFSERKKFYVAGGTFEEDPLLIKNSGLPFKCGEVQTRKNSQEIFSLERNIYYERLPKKWLKTYYDMKTGKSPEYQSPNFMNASRHQGDRTIYSGTIYLLLSDWNTCALFYHKTTDDCELWEKKRPGRDGMPSSFCSRYITACNAKTVNYYFNYTECHT